MKKLLLGSVFLTLFAISMTLFQASCQKDATANETPSGVIQQNKIIYSKRISKDNWDREIWTANYDGSNQKKLNIAFPKGVDVMYMSISPDGQKLFFSSSNGNPGTAIYTCNIDGSNLTKIIDGPGLGPEDMYLYVAF